MMNEEIFEEGYGILSQNVLTATKVEDDTIEGVINVDKDGLFYTSISYVDGWKAYVDGEEVEIQPVGGAMLAFNINKGSHVIKLRYTPEGFPLGVIVTVCGVLIFAAMIAVPILWKKFRPKKAVSAADPAEKDTADDTPDAKGQQE